MVKVFKCQYCGALFVKTHNRQVYCSDNCRHYGRRELKTEWQRQFRKKYGVKPTLGTGELGVTPRDDIWSELRTVEKEMRKRGLVPF